MATQPENGGSTLDPWHQVFYAAIIGGLAFLFGYNIGADKKLGAEVRRIAMAKEADTALVVGKKGDANLVFIPSGNPIPSCEDRNGYKECKFEVKVESDGKFVLINTKTQKPVSSNDIFAKVVSWVHKGSYCTTSSSGGTTTTNCCHHPSCW